MECADGGVWGVLRERLTAAASMTAISSKVPINHLCNVDRLGLVFSHFPVVKQPDGGVSVQALNARFIDLEGVSAEGFRFMLTSVLH